MAQACPHGQSDDLHSANTLALTAFGMTLTFTRLSLLALLLGALSGCSTWWGESTWEPPRLRLLKVETVKVQLLQQDFKLHFEVDNPNDSRLLVRGLRYKLMLGDLILAEDQVTDWFLVAGHSHEVFVVPVRTNLWRHAKPIARKLKQRDQPIPYRLEGKLKTGLLFRDSVRIGVDGEI